MRLLENGCAKMLKKIELEIQLLIIYKNSFHLNRSIHCVAT